LRNVLLTLAYDGSSYNGWQIQPNVPTVQGRVEEALHLLTGETLRADGTSRTDSGVHALAQRATVRGDFGIPADRIPIALNRLLSPDIRVVDASDMPERFHARYDARGKTYFYRIAVSSAPDIFLRNYRYWLKEKPNAVNMEQAAEMLIGKHDFAGFRSSGFAYDGDTVKTISSIIISEAEEFDSLGQPYSGICIEVSGDGFLYNMVRIIVGTLVEIGFGKKDGSDIEKILKTADRTFAGHVAPAGGLYLKEIFFGEDI